MLRNESAVFPAEAGGSVGLAVELAIAKLFRHGVETVFCFMFEFKQYSKIFIN